MTVVIIQVLLYCFSAKNTTWYMTLRFCRLLCFCFVFVFFKINFFEKLFKEYHQSVKQSGSRSDPTFCLADLGPSCLQTSSADDTGGQRVKTGE